MKRILHYLFVILLPAMLVIACKKNSGPKPTELLLSKVYHNEKLELEYEYDDENRLAKITEYDLASGKPAYSDAFTYDRSGIKTINSYNSSGKLTSIGKYSRDLSGQLTKLEYFGVSGADSGKVVTRIKYTSNKQGQIVKEAWVNLLTDKEVSYRKLSWYDNGNLKSSEYYGSVNPDVLWWETSYSPAGDSLPEQISGHSGYPVNYLNFYFSAEKIHYNITAIAGGPKEYEEVMSKREYNDAGLITKQNIATNYINPLQLSPKVEKRYEYIELESWH